VELTILGSGTCAPTKERSCASYFLQIEDVNILLDIGFGAIRRMMEAGIDYRQIDYVLCSHTHLDHVGDLGPLLMALEYTPGFRRQKPLTLIGPKGFQNYMNGLAGLYSTWIVSPTYYEIRIIELQDESRSFGTWHLTARSMSHSKETNGYRVQYKQRTMAYSGDTGFCTNVIRLMKDVDLGLLECSFPDDMPVEGHLTPSLAGQIAERAGVKKVLLTHLYPMMDDIDAEKICEQYYHGDVKKAKDLKVYKI